MEKGHSPVQSIDRLFDIVEALSNAPRGMALSDLSAAVGLHTSTTHRLLAAARGARVCAKRHRIRQIPADDAPV